MKHLSQGTPSFFRNMQTHICTQLFLVKQKLVKGFDGWLSCYLFLNYWKWCMVRKLENYNGYILENHLNPGIRSVPMCCLESSVDRRVCIVCLLNFSNRSASCSWDMLKMNLFFLKHVTCWCCTQPLLYEVLFFFLPKGAVLTLRGSFVKM